MTRTTRRHAAHQDVPTREPAGFTRRVGWPSIALVACGLVLYAANLDDPFIFDDENAIVSNPSIRQLSASLSPPANTPMAGRPVANLSFAVNYAVDGLDVGGYHAANVALHILCAWFVFELTRLTLLSPIVAEPVRRSAGGLALATALIWETHALNTEAVAYLTQRTELLAALFYLMTLVFAIRAWDAVRAGPWIAGAAIVCALGMGSKEIMVTAPVMVVLYDLAFTGRSPAMLWKRRRTLYAGLAATWIILLALQASGPRAATAGFSTSDVSASGYLASQAVSLTTYLRLAIWPSPLVLHYGYASEPRMSDIWPHVPVAIALFAATVWLFVRRPPWGFAGVWLLLILLPTTSIVPIVTEVTSERRMYLPLVSLVVTAVLIGRWIIVRAIGETTANGRRRDRAVQMAGPAMTLVAVIGLGWLTLARVAEFDSEIGLWQTVVARRPQNPLGHLNLGSALAHAGRSQEALAAYRQGLSLDPPEPEAWQAHFNLGQELLKIDSPEEALRHLQFCVDRQPTHATAQYMMGEALRRLDRWDESVDRYRTAIAIDPAFDVARAGLAASLLALGRPADAEPQYRELTQRNPDDPEVWKGLGLALALGGRIEDALTAYDGALALTPQDPVLHVWRGLAHVELGRLADARASYRRAIAIDPAHAEAHYLLANVLLADRATAEAIDHLREAVRVSPGYVEAHATLGAALMETGRLDEAREHARLARRLRPDDAQIASLAEALEGR